MKSLGLNALGFFLSTYLTGMGIAAGTGLPEGQFLADVQ